jgi:putative ABC transport system substrate-binding protein
MISRRKIIAGLLVATTVGRAQAQRTPKVYRIAIASPLPLSEMSRSDNPKNPYARAFYEELRRLGYVEGQNYVVELYSSEGRTEHFADLARDVVRSNPDLIYADGTRLVLAFKAATTSIPVVGGTSDPVANGIVASLARPGGNITGISFDVGFDIWGKRLELLRVAVPGASRVGFLASRKLWEQADVAAMREVAQRVGISLIGPPLDFPLDEAEYRRVIVAMAQAGAEALIVSNQNENSPNQRLIVELVERHRLPTIFPYRESVELGGLMTYGVDIVDLGRHVADQIDQILKGTKPGEIPIYQATKFELGINLKTAKALGLTIPSSLLAQADEVIE